MEFDLFSRWVNFLGLALAVGSIAFILLAWRPATRTLPPVLDRPLWVLVWDGWWAAGIGGVLLLLNQTSILLDQPVLEVLALDKLVDVIVDTRFGTLWLWRMALWGMMGGLLWLAGRSAQAARFATLCGLLMLLPMSMHSHAAVSDNVVVSILSDWVHLSTTALWVGGLVQLVVAIGALRKLSPPLAPKLGDIVARFSNYVRLSVAALLVTGLYATWHQMGALEAFVTTFYGRLLGFKLLLALLLLGLGAVNLIWTQRRLLAGQEVWVGRLRTLVSLEAGLALMILLAVSGMTAMNPARNELAQRAAIAELPPTPQPLPQPEPNPVHIVQDADDLQLHFTASPGWVGNSTFTIQVVDRQGAPVTDVLLIRLRFEHQSENLGESELQLRPETAPADGIYVVEGANLSAVGDWRVRMTVQRPEAFDVVTDFEFHVSEPPLLSASTPPAS